MRNLSPRTRRIRNSPIWNSSPMGRTNGSWGCVPARGSRLLIIGLIFVFQFFVQFRMRGVTPVDTPTKKVKKVTWVKSLNFGAGAIDKSRMFELFRRGEILPDGRTNQGEAA